MPFVSDRRLYLTTDGLTVVEEGDPRAAFLLVAVGGAISDADAEKYGLVPRETLNDEAAEEPEMKERKEAPKTKVVLPAENKSRKKKG